MKLIIITIIITAYITAKLAVVIFDYLDRKGCVNNNYKINIFNVILIFFFLEVIFVMTRFKKGKKLFARFYETIKRKLI